MAKVEVRLAQNQGGILVYEWHWQSFYIVIMVQLFVADSRANPSCT